MSTSRPAADEIEPGIPATVEMTSDVHEGWDEEEPAPLDRPQGVNKWGATAREEALGESVDERRKREEPDFPRRSPEEGVRLVDPEDPSFDDEAALVGEYAEDDGHSTLSAEEAAMRVVDEPPGASYDPTPGYLDDDE